MNIAFTMIHLMVALTSSIRLCRVAIDPQGQFNTPASRETSISFGVLYKLFPS